MVINNRPWGEIVPAFLSELRRCQYPTSNINQIKQIVSDAQTYCLSQGIDEYSIEIGQEFLSKFYPIVGHFSTWQDVSPQTKCAYWSIGLFNDYLLHGYFTTSKRTKLIPLMQSQETMLLNFQKYQIENGYAATSSKRNAYYVRSFLTYLNGKNVELKDISQKDIVDFLSCYIDLSKPYITANICAIKRFTRFLYATGLTTEDLTSSIPPVNRLASPRVPSVWEDDDIDKLLESIDRGAPLGKRDYAILMLAVKLGLRCSDIKNLKFNDIDWEKRSINIIQRKTQKQLVIPFPDDVGWAIIDYIKNARPKSEFTHIFLTHVSPIRPFSESSTLHSMISRYRNIAGIEINERARRGMHSLRHTFATRLLRNGIPLETIAEMLGHVGMSSVDVYLSVDTEELRMVALNPEEVYHDRSDNSYC